MRLYPAALCLVAFTVHAADTWNDLRGYTLAGLLSK
jgi:hypothetical protein